MMLCQTQNYQAEQKDYMPYCAAMLTKIDSVIQQNPD